METEILNPEWAIEFARAYLMLLSDRPTKPTDTVYVPLLSDGMIASCEVLDTVVWHYHTGFPRCVSYNGERGELGLDDHGGADSYEKFFTEYGIPKERLVPTGVGKHSRSETDELVKLAKGRSWTSAVLVTVPYHYPRMVLGCLQSMKEFDHHLDLYVGQHQAPMDWDLPMMGSQGKERTTAFTEYRNEVEKVFVYQQKGDLAPFTELYEHMRNRA